MLAVILEIVEAGIAAIVLAKIPEGWQKVFCMSTIRRAGLPLSWSAGVAIAVTNNGLECSVRLQGVQQRVVGMCVHYVQAEAHFIQLLLQKALHRAAYSYCTYQKAYNSTC